MTRLTMGEGVHHAMTFEHHKSRVVPHLHPDSRTTPFLQRSSARVDAACSIRKRARTP